MKIDKNKKYKTKSGWEVRIYATDGPWHDNVHGAINRAGQWIANSWFINGQSSFIHDGRHTTEDDLVETKPRIRRERWVNVYDDCEVFSDTKQECDESYEDYKKNIPDGPDRIACVKVVIDCEHGEGL